MTPLDGMLYLIGLHARIHATLCLLVFIQAVIAVILLVGIWLAYRADRAERTRP